MYLVYNSDILSENTFSISHNSRAFQYGDGLFETIRYENGTVWFWVDHIDRLRRGMQVLHLNVPPDFSEETMYQTVEQLLSANNLTNQPARIKLMVWRRPGGLYTPTTNEVDWLLTVRPGKPFTVSDREQLGIFTDCRITPSPVSAFKTLNALPYVLAGLYKQHHSLDDVVLLDTRGYVAESVASSIFWFTDGQLFTPSLETGCIDGILRRQLIRLFSVREGIFTPAQLLDADAVFCTNVAGIQWFNRLENRVFANAAEVMRKVEEVF